MAGRRFRKIKGLIKMAKAMGVDVSEDDNIKAYRAYRDGTSTSYEVKGVPRGSSTPVTLIPFYVRNFTNEFRHATKMSGRAAANMTNVGATEAELNINSVGTTAATRGRLIKGFRPAKVVATLYGETVTDKKSGILLLDYKKRAGSSYTYPFGAANTAGRQTYPEMCGTLLKDMGKANGSLSFKQEKPGLS